MSRVVQREGREEEEREREGRGDSSHSLSFTRDLSYASDGHPLTRLSLTPSPPYSPLPSSFLLYPIPLRPIYEEERVAALIIERTSPINRKAHPYISP